MRVLTFLHSFEPGGVERIAWRLHRAWRALGVDARMVIGRPDGAAPDAADRTDAILLSDGRLPTAAWETLWMMTMLPRVVRRERPDVVFCAGNTYAVVAAALRLTLGRQCPPIVAKVSNDLERRDMNRLVRRLYRRWLRLQPHVIDTFVGMAEPMRREIADRMRIGAERIAIVHDPAIDTADLATALWSAPGGAGRRFLSAGRLSAQKNFALLLGAFARIATPHDRLTILGEGPDRRALLRLATALGIADRVDLPGFVGRTRDWFADSDVFVLSSDYEGVPAVIIEALAAGLPIVATDCSVSMAAMLGNGACGRLVPVGSESALAAAMAAVAEQPGDPAQRRDAARAFTLEAAAGAYRDVFAAVIAKRPAGRDG